MHDEQSSQERERTDEAGCNTTNATIPRMEADLVRMQSGIASKSGAQIHCLLSPLSADKSAEWSMREVLQYQHARGRRSPDIDDRSLRFIIRRWALPSATLSLKQKFGDVSPGGSKICNTKSGQGLSSPFRHLLYCTQYRRRGSIQNPLLLQIFFRSSPSDIVV